MQKRRKTQLFPNKQEIEENEEFVNHPDCKETVYMSVDHYKKVGYNPPWIGYYAKHNNEFVGSVGFKGAPKDGIIEIAYGIFEKFRQKGLGTEMCRHLVELSLHTDSSVLITARILPEKNYSTRILEKNGFELLGAVIDDEDGEVWEWKYKNAQAHNRVDGRER